MTIELEIREKKDALLALQEQHRIQERVAREAYHDVLFPFLRAKIKAATWEWGPVNALISSPIEINLDVWDGHWIRMDEIFSTDSTYQSDLTAKIVEGKIAFLKVLGHPVYSNPWNLRFKKWCAK